MVFAKSRLRGENLHVEAMLDDVWGAGSTLRRSSILREKLKA